MVSIEKIISYWYLLGRGRFWECSNRGCNMESKIRRIVFIGDKKSYNFVISVEVAAYLRRILAVYYFVRRFPHPRRSRQPYAIPPTAE